MAYWTQKSERKDPINPVIKSFGRGTGTKQKNGDIRLTKKTWEGGWGRKWGMEFPALKKREKISATTLVSRG